MAHDKKIFIDLDGVMADFDKYFFERFGKVCQLMEDDEMWAVIDTEEPDFFSNLPMMPDAIEIFAKAIQFSDPIFLTACPKHNYHNAAEQKKEWVRKHVCKYALVLPVLGGINKRCFIQRPGDILIDDFKKNISAWTENGGHGILHLSVEQTKKELADAYYR